MRDRQSPRRGQVVILIALLSGLIFALGAFAVDFIFAYSVKSRLVTAIDASALAAARTLGQGQMQMNRIIDLIFDSNFPEDFLLTKSRSHATPVITQPSPGVREVYIRGDVLVPTFFMRLAGYTSLPIVAEATASRRDVNMMLVVDRSASLHPSRADAWDDVQQAAIFFVQQFDDTVDKIGLVTFGTGANVDVPIGTGFKTPIVNAINTQIVPFSAATNSPQGMWLAYAELLGELDANPVNAIVFFTDGQPSAYTADFAVRTAPTGNNSIPFCDSSPKTGVIASGQDGPDFVNISGLFNHQAGPPPIAVGFWGSWDYDHFIVANCNNPNNNFAPWGAAMERLFASGCLPFDWTASHTPQGGSTITRTFPIDEGPFSVDQCASALHSTSNDWTQQNIRGTQVHNASKNLTINIAEDARSNAALGQVRIYSIGLGGFGFPADADFLRRVSNDPLSPTFDESQPRGLYAFAPTPMQLRQAFQTIANEIFRLIR